MLNRVENAKLDQRALRRKILSLKDLIAISEVSRIRCEREIDSKELELDKDDNFQLGLKETKVSCIILKPYETVLTNVTSLSFLTFFIITVY